MLDPVEHVLAPRMNPFAGRQLVRMENRYNIRHGTGKESLVVPTTSSAVLERMCMRTLLSALHMHMPRRYLPYVGMVTIVMNDYPWVKYLLIGVLGLFVITGKGLSRRFSGRRHPRPATTQLRPYQVV